MAIEDQISVARKLAAAASARLQIADIERLLGASLRITDDQLVRENVDLYETVVRGFLNLAAKGETFVPLAQIEALFGKTLSENYPEANDVFLRFAATYWTFKLWIDHEVENAVIGANPQKQSLVTSLFLTLEEQIAGLFFPTPGPVAVAPDQREAAQRQLFRNFNVPIDVDAFVAGNPILIRDRSQRSGCLGSAVIIAGIVVAVAFLAVWLFRDFGT